MSRPTVADRLAAKTAPARGGCLVFTASKNNAGYGRLRVGDKTVGAHRVAWELANGPIPGGLYVCHHCDNPPCVNVAHLFLGTNADNMADMARKGRAVTPRAGARVTIDQVAAIRDAYAAGGVSMAALGERYGITAATVCRMVNRRTWAL
jgi:hypothetical protein